MTSTRRLLTGCAVVAALLVPAACGGAAGKAGFLGALTRWAPTGWARRDGLRKIVRQFF
jgi:ABC-type glycerol-3-phosphate transport system substrate-binding protein